MVAICDGVTLASTKARQPEFEELTGNYINDVKLLTGPSFIIHCSVRNSGLQQRIFQEDGWHGTVGSWWVKRSFFCLSARGARCLLLMPLLIAESRGASTWFFSQKVAAFYDFAVTAQTRAQLPTISFSSCVAYEIRIAQEHAFYINFDAMLRVCGGSHENIKSARISEVTG